MENQNTNTQDQKTDVQGNVYQTTGNTNSSMLTGMFSDRESTESAYNTLHERGYGKEDVHVLMSDETRKKHFSEQEAEIGTKAMSGMGTGSAIGGTIGAVAGIIAAIGTTLAIPGLGVVIAGPVAAALAGAGAGGFTGGLVGAMIGAGIPEARARVYGEGIKNGKIVLGVNPRNDEDADYFKNNWRENRGEEIHH